MQKVYDTRIYRFALFGMFALAELRGFAELYQAPLQFEHRFLLRKSSVL